MKDLEGNEPDMVITYLMFLQVFFGLNVRQVGEPWRVDPLPGRVR